MSQGEGSRAHRILGRLFEAAVEATSPAACLAAHLPEKPTGRTVVVGAGKAAASMAQALEAAWDGPMSGLVITPYGHGADCRFIEVVEAAHPVLDDAGLQATGALIERLAGLSANDLVICLISGGGSALLTRPAAGVTLAEKQTVTRALLKSGAAIGEINCVRKHLSAVKGGRLAVLAAPARVVTLAISDVPGDDPSVIASGPTVPDPTTREQAAAIVARDVPDAPASVTSWLADPASETPKPDGREPDVRIIASPATALAAAANAARAQGYEPWIFDSYVEGEARDAARSHARAVRAVLEGRGPVRAPCAILSGGETTVTVRGGGRGGRNAEFLLALAIELDGLAGVQAMAVDTDGIDGSGDNAGAVITDDVLARARTLGVSPGERLASNDGYGFFEAVGGLIFSGPTRTNVNDLRVILIDRPESEPQE